MDDLFPVRWSLFFSMVHCNEYRHGFDNWEEESTSLPFADDLFAVRVNVRRIPEIAPGLVDSVEELWIFNNIYRSSATNHGNRR